MKAVLISIRPKWVELIAAGKKTVELRKTKPSIEPPFRCYMYMSKYHWTFDLLRKYGMDDLAEHLMMETGKVIGEFTCDGFDKYIEVETANYARFYMKEIEDQLLAPFDLCETCLTEDEFSDYSQGKDLYGWHISDLKIYDKPVELLKFYNWKEEGSEIKRRAKRPPQSWAYVEAIE